MKRHHTMPFGAQLHADGGVTFRLWAPDARSVELLVEDDGSDTSVPMAAQADGWFEVYRRDTNADTHYRFRCDEGLCVPDPASRYNPHDVHGPSQVTDPRGFEWQDTSWQGRRWEEAVIYELHVGCFTAAGTFNAVSERLDYLCELGVTAIELMPIADFPGARNWGYDGVLPFAPDSRYGTPNELKALIQAAHQRGLMVFLDVVYNHFGPEGNYLHAYAKRFFTDRHATPWGTAINFDGADSGPVRDFFIHNALYWLEEFHFDGLRFDAVHAIKDDSRPDILEAIVTAVRAGPGGARHIHLILENDDNGAHYLRHTGDGHDPYTAQWNDDLHHALHVLLTAETEGYYSDYAQRPAWYLGRCLSEGFGFQGESSAYREQRSRGAASHDLPATAFVNFLQNHDQIGNRAEGERLAALVKPQALRAALTVLLLSPAPPLLFMGEEFGATQPFLFFCDFEPQLAAAVTEGRRREFAKFPRFSSASARAAIPDPNAVLSFERSRLDWLASLQAPHQAWLSFYHELLSLRQREIVPHLQRDRAQAADFRTLSHGAVEVVWRFEDKTTLVLLTNLSEAAIENVTTPRADLLYSANAASDAFLEEGVLAPWTTAWWLCHESE